MERIIAVWLEYYLPINENVLMSVGEQKNESVDREGGGDTHAPWVYYPCSYSLWGKK